MKVTGIISTAALSLLLGIGAPAFAQNDQKDEKQDHPSQQESKHEQAKPEQKQAQQRERQDQGKEKQAQQKEQKDQNNQKQQAQQKERQDQGKEKQAQQKEQKDQNNQKQQAQQKERQDQGKQKQQAQQQRRNEQPQRTQEQQRVERSAWQEHRARSWKSDHRTWQQRGGYNGYRIPDDRFRGYFGPSHGFRIYGLPFLVVGGYPRFQYSGFWFSLVDPWPESWAENWYDTDDVYVTYVDNGYYLFNRRHPNVGIAISISM